MNVKDELLQTVGVLLAAAALAGLSLLRKSVSERVGEFFERLLARFDKQEQITEQDTERHRHILNAVVELRVLTGADRAFVSLFHNGSVFLIRDPVWKISRAYEVCRAGIAYRARQLQEVPVSILMDQINVLWGAEPPHGVSRLEVADDERACSTWAYGFDVTRMPDSQLRAMLQEDGVFYRLLVPLHDDREQIVGYVGVEYCDVDADPAALAAHAEQVCLQTHVLEYRLRRKSSE
jgi:hypothetical protein